MRGPTVLAACGAMVVGSGVVAQDSLESRLEALEQGIARYKAQVNGQEWWTQRRAREVRALVQDALHDAENRISLRDDPRGLVAAATLGAFDERVMQVAIETKFLLVSNHFLEDLGVGFDDDDHRTGFENPQSRATFSGELDATQFRVQGNFNEVGEMQLQDAWIGRDIGGNAFLQVGQFKPPFALESLMDDFDLTTIFRSFQVRPSERRVQGLMLTLTPGERSRVMASFNDGIASENRPWDREDVEGAVTVRAEFLAVDNFNNDIGLGNYLDFLSLPGSGSGVLLGGGAHYQKGESGTPANETDLFSATADATVKLDGLTFHGAGFYSDVDNGEDSQAFGTVLMVSPVIVDGKVQLYLKHEFIDVEVGDEDSDGHIVTVGGSRFIGPNRQIKLSAEVGYTDGVPFLSDIPLLGSLFRRDYRDEGRQELIILIQAQVSMDQEW